MSGAPEENWAVLLTIFLYLRISQMQHFGLFVDTFHVILLMLLQCLFVQVYT